MSLCLLDDVNSPYSWANGLVALANFETQDIEDRLAELFVETCQGTPQRVWQRCDLGDVVLHTIQSVAPLSWREADAESLKSLLIIATRIARQIIPFYRRDF